MKLLDFRLGFICAPRRHRFREQSFLHRWNRFLFPAYKVFIHPEAGVHRVDGAGGEIVLAIGDVFVAHGDDSLDQLLLRIAAGSREPLDDLSGRFALLVFRGEEGTILHDALGSQSVFRTLGSGPVVASHSSLIAECESIGPSPRIKRYMASAEYRARVTRFLPGDWSIYDNIVHLVPNNELDLQSGKTTRYWPRADTPSSSFNDVLTVWDEYFSRYASFIKPRYHPVIGLTGGLDSRAVIATLRKYALRPDFITWDKMPLEEATRIPLLANHLGGNHSWVRMSVKPDSARANEVRQAARTAAGLTRGTPLLPAQIDELVQERSLFIKGLGGEVMRGPFNSRLKSHLPRTYEDLGYVLYAGQVRKSAGVEYEAITREAVRGFLERANYSSELHNADPGDLIYWEQRMGTWTAVQHAEFSVVLNSHSAMNSRKLFAASWGLADEDRFGPGLLENLMRKYDPRIAEL